MGKWHGFAGGGSHDAAKIVTETQDQAVSKTKPGIPAPMDAAHFAEGARGVARKLAGPPATVRQPSGLGVAGVRAAPSVDGSYGNCRVEMLEVVAL